MEVTPVKVFIYETESGKRPYSEWLEGLGDKKTKGIIRARLNRVRLGNFGDCKPVGEEVFEFRIDRGPGFRLYFGKEGKEIVILLSGGTKKGQDRDIKKAKEYWADYRSRKDE
jgi:putative addiction module killer protein